MNKLWNPVFMGEFIIRTTKNMVKNILTIGFRQ